MSSGDQRQRVGRQAALSDWIHDLVTAASPGDDPAARAAERRFGRSSEAGGEQGFHPEELAAELRRRRLEDGDHVRPYVLANLAVADDGRPAADPRAAGALEPGVAVEAVARSEADAVLIGAGALRSGRYDRPLADPERREHRRGRGLARDPWAS